MLRELTCVRAFWTFTLGMSETIWVRSRIHGWELGGFMDVDCGPYAMLWIFNSRIALLPTVFAYLR